MLVVAVVVVVVVTIFVVFAVTLVETLLLVRRIVLLTLGSGTTVERFVMMILLTIPNSIHVANTFGQVESTLDTHRHNYFHPDSIGRLRTQSSTT